MAEFVPGLVTLFGGSGFIGSQAVRTLAKRGWRVRIAVRNPTQAIEIQPLGDVGQIQFMHCDIGRDEDVARAVRGANAVVNLVGVLAEGGKRSFQALHVEGGRRIAQHARTAGVERMVQISAIGADANSPSGYGRSKAEAEAAVRAVYANAVILRPSVVFGSGDSFLNRFAHMAAYGPGLPLIGGGETRFQPVYVGDVAEAVARAVSVREAGGRTYELGGPSVYSFEDLMKLVLRETNRSKPLIGLPFGAAKMLATLMKPLGLLGIEPPITGDQVLMLQRDTVVGDDAEGLAALGIEPTGLEAIAPSYLWRFRRGGQFAEAPIYAGGAGETA